jgi:hypothetical protein
MRCSRPPLFGLAVWGARWLVAAYGPRAERRISALILRSSISIPWQEPHLHQTSSARERNDFVLNGKNAK